MNICENPCSFKYIIFLPKYESRFKRSYSGKLSGHLLKCQKYIFSIPWFEKTGYSHSEPPINWTSLIENITLVPSFHCVLLIIILFFTDRVITCGVLSLLAFSIRYSLSRPSLVKYFNAQVNESLLVQNFITFWDFWTFVRGDSPESSQSSFNNETS